MKLVHRVSGFFLVALAVALVGYSAVFWLLARSALYQQFDRGLHNALDLLAASVEVEEDDAKWDPAEHGIDLEQDTLNAVHWVVADETGQVLDHSQGISHKDSDDLPILAHARHQHAEGVAEDIGQWRVVQRTLAAASPKSADQRAPHEHARITITVASSQATLDATLARLALLLCVIPVAVWLLAAGTGRWVVGKALAPVAAMARQARSAQADFATRLSVQATGDELAELGGAFNQLLAQLQQAFERQRRLTADAAHQLRTPVAVLQGQIEVALRRPRSAEDYQVTLGTLAEVTGELRELVETLLFLARAENEAETPHQTELSLANWLRDYAVRWSAHERYGDLALELTADCSLLTSAGLLRQLLDCLMDNAFRYSEPGTPVVVRTCEANGVCYLAISDSGIGLAATDRAMVFEPFFRAEAAQRKGISGTGLGLAIAARIATALGGQLTCESELHRGSTFLFAISTQSKPQQKNPR